MRARSFRVAAAVALFFGMSVTGFAGKKIPIDALPPAVFFAVADRFPDAQFLSAERDKDDGRIMFEVKIRTGGKKIELDVTPFGQIVKIDD